MNGFNWTLAKKELIKATAERILSFGLEKPLYVLGLDSVATIGTEEEGFVRFLRAPELDEPTGKAQLVFTRAWFTAKDLKDKVSEGSRLDTKSYYFCEEIVYHVDAEHKE